MQRNSDWGLVAGQSKLQVMPRVADRTLFCPGQCSVVESKFDEAREWSAEVAWGLCAKG